MKPTVVSFDLDGTLIRNTNTMELMCGLNGRFDDCVYIQDRISIQKDLDWVEGDYIRAEYMTGAHAGELDAWFGSHVRVIEGLDEVLRRLLEEGITPILVTTGPRQVAECMKRRYPFSEVYGSIYEEKDGIMTGKILRHLFHHGGKFGCVEDYCRQHGLDSRYNVVVGDSYSDREIFERSARAIAINYTEDVAPYADYLFRTENLTDILPALLKEF